MRLLATLIGLLLSGCASSDWFATEYSKDYTLAYNTSAGDCHTFTGTYSLLFGGLETVTCFKGAGDLVLKKGSAVKVKRIFRITTIDNTDQAVLVVTDPDTGEKRQIYSVDWQQDRKKLY